MRFGSRSLISVCFMVALRLESQTLQTFSPTKRDHPTLTVFADGNVKDVVGQPGNATSTTGALGMTYRGSAYIVSGVVNVLSRTDTVVSGYGASLLPPGTGRSFNSVILDGRKPSLPFLDCSSDPNSKLCSIGLHVYASAATSRWATARNDSGRVTSTVDVPIWGGGAGLYYRFFDSTVADSSFAAMALDLGWATRHVRGDLFSHPTLRASLLQSGLQNFDGLEIGLSMRYNELSAGLTYYYFTGAVPGLSRGQVVAAIAIRAKLNSGEYKDPEPK